MNQRVPVPMLPDEGGTPSYTRKDFASEQLVRWCPGCGDYSILAQVQRVMPEVCSELGVRREQLAFISGIGCASRFPYYMNTYGFHSVHGRAPTLATGLRLVRPDLMVWVVTGDGDALSIGGNHLLHVLRRNVDLKILLFNNRIYGLTKGQYSPTSERGKRTKSSPWGAPEEPLEPLVTAIAAGATFAARTVATEATHLQEVLLRAARHRGSAFVEILQNCPVFNDGAFDELTEGEDAPAHRLELVHGEPAVFGREGERVLALDPQRFDFAVADADTALARAWRHDETLASPLAALALARLGHAPGEPVALGVLRAVEAPTYEERVAEAGELARRSSGEPSLQELLTGPDAWTVLDAG